MAKRLLDELVAGSANLTAIRSSLIDWLARDGSNRPKVRAELEGLDFGELLHAYIRRADGLITERRREVLLWDGFWGAGRAQEHRADIARLVELIERGDDLSPYLSPKPYPEKDRALNAYNTHHLHFVPTARGRRSGDSNSLLYVRVERHRLHLVLCGDHRSFDDGSLRQAVADFDAENGHYIRGIVGVSRDFSASEGEAMLRKGVNVMTKSGDHWAAPGMLSTDMTSIDHLRHADEITIAIEEWEPKLRTDEGRRALCDLIFIEYTSDCSFGWALHGADLYLAEERSGVGALCVPWRR